jgi:hypothetical protein
MITHVVASFEDHDSRDTVCVVNRRNLVRGARFVSPKSQTGLQPEHLETEQQVNALPAWAGRDCHPPRLAVRRDIPDHFHTTHP